MVTRILMVLALLIAVAAIWWAVSPLEEHTTSATLLVAEHSSDAGVGSELAHLDSVPMPSRTNDGGPEPLAQVATTQLVTLEVLVTDDLGAPLPDVFVRLGTEEPTGLHYSDRTSENGIVQFWCPERSYFVHINRGARSNGTHGDALLVVQADHEVGRQVAVLERNSAGISLHVVDGQGEPITGLLVEARGPLGGAAGPEPQQTDERGEVSWSRLTPGRWRLSTQSDDPTLNLQEGADKFVVLVSDRVELAEWVFPRNGLVIVDLGSVPFLAELDRLSLEMDSRFPPWPAELTWRVPAGSYTLFPIWAADSESYSVPLEVTALEGEVVRVALAAEAGAVSLSGRLVDSRGGGIEGARITTSVYSKGVGASLGDFLATKTSLTDASGAWFQRGLPRGELSALAYCGDVAGRYLDESVRVGDGVTVEGAHLDLRDTTVRAAVRLTCDLSGGWRSESEAIEGARLELRRVAPPPPWNGYVLRAVVDQSGVCDFERVVVGEHLVQLVRPDGSVIASEVLHLPLGVGEGESVRHTVGD